MAYTSTLKKINREAKRLYAKNGGSYKAAVKAASANYRAGKLGAVGAVKRKAKKKTARKRPPARRIVPTSKVVTIRNAYAVGSIAATKSRLKKQLEEKLSWLLMGHYNAKTKTKKRHYLKLMVPIKQQLRQLTK